MKNNKIYAIEMYKVMKRRSTYVLLVILILPVFNAISTYLDASYMEVEGISDMFMSASINWILLQYVYLPQILFALMITRIFGYELEDGQIKLLLTKGCSRKRLIIIKMLTNISLAIGLYVIFHVVSYVIDGVLFGRMFQVEMFLEHITADNARHLLMDMIYLINIIIISNIVMCLCLFKKPFTSFMIGVGINFATIFMQYFPIARYFVPMYVANQLSTYSISNTKVVGVFLGYTVIAIIPIIIAIRKFEKIDIK